MAHRRAADRAASGERDLPPDLQGPALAAAMTARVEALVERLRTLTVEIKPILFDFESVKRDAQPAPFDPEGLDVEEPLPSPDLPSPPPGLLAKMLPSSRVKHDRAVAEAREAHERELAAHAERESLRKKMLAEAMAGHERGAADATARAAEGNRRVDGLRARIEAGEPAVLAAYHAAVLAASDYPDGFPRHATVALDPGGRILVIDYELPPLGVVPSAQAFRYDEDSGRMEEVPRPPARRKDLYAVVVASVALRSVRELFDADRVRAFDAVGFNGYVHGVDRVSGEAVRPHLVSFTARREQFRMLDIARTDPIVSMRTLEAAFSTNPAELASVREVIGVRSLGPGAALASSPKP